MNAAIDKHDDEEEEVIEGEVSFEAFAAEKEDDQGTV